MLDTPLTNLDRSKPRMYMRGYAHRLAFTLTELLIVIGIIVLFVTLALPAFNLISGSKSIAGTENIISALLSRARNEAMGVQAYRGIAIYRDAGTDRYFGAIVAPVAFSAYPTMAPTPAYPIYSYVTYGGQQYVATQSVLASATFTPPSPATGWSPCSANPSAITMDIETDTDVTAFSAGVGVNVINNCGVNTGSTPPRSSNGYLPVGVILFTGEGVMKLNNVSFAIGGHLGATGNFGSYPNLVTGQGSIPNYVSTATGLPLSSSFGLVAFDKQSFDTQNFFNGGLPSQLVSTLAANSTTNTVYTGNTQEQAADTWLDTNSTPLLINRYNGTLVRSE